MKLHVISRNFALWWVLLSGSYNVSAKKVQRSYLWWHWRVMQSLKKNWLVVSNMTWGIWRIFTQPLGSFCPKCAYSLYTLFVQRFELQKYRGIIFYDTEQWYKIWINPDLVVPKMAWAIGWTFIRALKCLKNYTLVDSFCPKHIMFQLENFRGVMCHDTEGWCKI